MSESETPEAAEPVAPSDAAESTTESTTDTASADAAAQDTVAAHAAGGHDTGHGEGEIHMPPNSWWPLVVSIGVTVTLLGVLYIESMPAIIIVGGIILLGGIGGWIKDARTEYRELH